MNPDLKPWLGGALAAFLDGFIDGLPVGAPTGGLAAIADGQTHLDFQWQHIAVEVAHVIAVPVFTGLADIRAYKKDHPLPNLFVTAPAKP
jgi:hypothetical protein